MGFCQLNYKNNLFCQKKDSCSFILSTCKFHPFQIALLAIDTISISQLKEIYDKYNDFGHAAYLLNQHFYYANGELLTLKQLQFGIVMEEENYKIYKKKMVF